MMLAQLAKSNLLGRQALRTVGVASQARRGYHEKVINHYEKPRNVSTGNCTCIIPLAHHAVHRLALSPRTMSM